VVDSRSEKTVESGLGEYEGGGEMGIDGEANPLSVAPLGASDSLAMTCRGRDGLLRGANPDSMSCGERCILS
jgi:hypothetical protein